MHRPSSWGAHRAVQCNSVKCTHATQSVLLHLGAGMLQFAPPEGAPLCRNIEFPGRHLAMSLHIAQRNYAAKHKTFARTVKQILSETYCSLQLSTSDTCDLSSLQYAVAHPEIFTITFDVQESAKELTRECTARPCFTAQTKVVVPGSAAEGGGYTYIASINEDRWLRVAHHPTSPQQAPCL